MFKCTHRYALLNLQVCSRRLSLLLSCWQCLAWRRLTRQRHARTWNRATQVMLKNYNCQILIPSNNIYMNAWRMMQTFNYNNITSYTQEKIVQTFTCTPTGNSTAFEIQKKVITLPSSNINYTGRQSSSHDNITTSFQDEA